MLDNFCEVFGENGNSLVNELNILSGDVGKPINIYPLITRAALSIICGNQKKNPTLFNEPSKR